MIIGRDWVYRWLSYVIEEVGSPFMDIGLYQYSRLETDQGWTLEPDNFEGSFWGDKRIGSFAPNLIFDPPGPPPRHSQGPVSSPGPFQAGNIDTKLCIIGRDRLRETRVVLRN